MNNQLGRRHTTDDIQRIRTLLGLIPTPAGSTDHGTLLGLADDDHAQYLHLSAARNISAQHTFAPESLQAPFLLDSNAQSQTVVGLKADQLNKSIVAGNGLTGGGALTASRTLNVGAGAGITVNADDVALTLPGTLSAASTNNSSGNHTHAVTASSNPGAAASLLKTTSAGKLYLINLLTDTINDRSGGSLTVAPTGDLLFNPGGKDMLPVTAYDLNIGSLSKKYLTLHAAELWVETLVAQNTIATIGGRVLVGPTTLLEADAASGATSIQVRHNEMAVGDTAYMEADGKVEFMAITSGPTGGGPYTYGVTRNLDGSGANDWYAGDAVFNTGQAGDGFIDLYSINGVKSALEAGPTIVGNVRGSATYNDWTEHWAIGNLNGLYGYASDTYGVALGKYTANSWLSADATNGIRMVNKGTVRFQVAADGMTTINDSGGSAVFTFDASAGAEFTKPLTLGSGGGIYQGTGSFTSPTTGLKIWNDGGIGRIAGYNAGTLQWGATTSGYLTAGAGAVRLSANGVLLSAYTSIPSPPTLHAYQLGTYNDLYAGLWFQKDETGGQEKVGPVLYATQDFPSGGPYEAQLSLDADPADGLLLAHNSNFIRFYAGKIDADNHIRSDGGLVAGDTSLTPSAGQVLYTDDLIARRSATNYTVYGFVPLTTGLTSTNWDGDAKTTADNGTIDLSAEFGVPANVKAVLVRLAHSDSTPGRVCRVGPNAAWSYTLTTVTPAAGIQDTNTAIVPCDNNGDIYFYCNGDVNNVYMQIYGYML